MLVQTETRHRTVEDDETRPFLEEDIFAHTMTVPALYNKWTPVLGCTISTVPVFEEETTVFRVAVQASPDPI